MRGVVRHELVGAAASVGASVTDRLRIAHLSDIHLWWGDGPLREIEPLLAHWRPDVLALTGDYADTPLGQRAALRWIERLGATYPLCWIAGNHDGWWGGSFLKKLTALPCTHAIDRADAWIAARNGRRYRFTAWERFRRADSVSGSCDREPTVVLLHDPAQADAPALKKHPCALLLAGHLHGGQLVLWRDRQHRPQPASLFYKWVPERTEVGGVPMIVSRGWGDTLPLRWRAPRELVIVDLLLR